MLNSAFVVCLSFCIHQLKINFLLLWRHVRLKKKKKKAEENKCFLIGNVSGASKAPGTEGVPSRELFPTATP